MALFAATTADVQQYVSRKDPARGKDPIKWVDPDKKEKGELITQADVDRWRERGATVFHIQPLDVFLMGWIYDRASVLRGNPNSADIDIHTKMNSTNLDAVRFGLKDIENFRIKNEDSGTLVFETVDEHVNGRDYVVAKNSMLNAMRDIFLIGEIADRIKIISEVGTDEEKNSGTVSLPQG